MTKEENLHWLNQEIRTWKNECQSKHPIKEALYAARKALEQEPCEDAVSRDDVVRIVQHNNPPKALEKIRKLPSVTPQEPALDKIREEIGKAWHTKPKNRYEEGLKDQALKDMQIINKYKAESEVNNGTDIN